MDDVTRHPDDATLFDLVEETLDPARAEQVRAHLSRCAACAAFVAAARTGAPVASSAVEPMPEAAAAKLDAAVKTAWRERVAGIAAAEAAQDAAPAGGMPGAEIATTPVPVPEPSSGQFAGYAPTSDAARATDSARPSAPPRRRGRRLVPVLAFVVLGTLAGTSILIDNETSTSEKTTVNRDGGAETPDVPLGATSGELQGDTAVSGEAPGVTSVPDPAAAPTAGAAGAGAGSNTDSETTAEASKSARDSTAAPGDIPTAEPTIVPPPGDYDEFVDQERICLATLDEAQLALPNGRIPTQITQGPFGIYLVCG